MEIQRFDWDGYLEAVGAEAALGSLVVESLKRLRAHPLGQFIEVVPPHQKLALPESLVPLYEVMGRRQEPARLPGALDLALRGAGQSIPLRFIPRGAEWRRAPSNEPGLVACSLGLLGAARHLGPAYPLPVDLRRMEVLTVQVKTGQALLEVVTGFSGQAEGNVAQWETELLKDCRTLFDLVVPMASINEDVERALTSARLYLKGPAEQGAKKRQDNQQTVEKLTVKAQAAGQTAANEAAKKAIFGQLRNIMDTGEGEGAAAAKDEGRRAPR